MKKFTKIISIVAACIIVVGLCLTVCGYIAGAKNGVYIKNGKLFMDGDEVERFTYSQDDIKEISNIDISVSNAKVELVPSHSEYFTIAINVYKYGQEPEITTDNGKIRINQSNDKFWLNFSLSGIFNAIHSLDDINVITIGIPTDITLEDVNISTSNGAIETSQIMTVKNVDIDTSNGHIDMKNITCTGNLQAKTSNGTIDCDGVWGTNSYFKSSNGKVSVAGLYNGDVECKTSNGAIDFKCSESKDKYDFSANTSNGKVFVNGVDTDNSYKNFGDSRKKITLKTSNGRIEAEFK